MANLPLELQTDFFRPLVNGWLGKLEAAERYRKKWREVADECHDALTEVLTDCGWKFFKDLDGNEALGTVNLDTDTIEYQKPSRLVKNHKNGDMLRFSGKTLDAMVTPNHRMVYFQPHSEVARVKEANELFRSDQLKLTAANWVGQRPVLPEFLPGVDAADFAEWLGFYIAEGFCDKHQHGEGKQTYRVAVTQVKDAGRRYYEGVSAKMPFRSPPYQQRSKAYVFSNKNLCEYLRQFGDDCYNKCVPQWVKDAPQEIIQAFLRGYIAGDGHVADDGQTVTSTASRRLADDIQELWLKVGRSASITERQPAPYSITDPGTEARTGMSGIVYLVVAWKAGKRASIKRHNGSEIELKYHTEQYEGMVYCATVPNGTLITRRNGLPLISGNCMMFYARSAAAMSDSNYARKFWKGTPNSRFRISINKAFEVVAIYGPNLLWDTPHVEVEPKRPLELPLEMFGDPQQPGVQEFHQAVQQELAQMRAEDIGVSTCLQGWLNYNTREGPGGGLEGQSEMALTDSLIKGRGCLWTRPYQPPGSQRTLVGSFREPPENLLIDPDFDTLHQAKWIARRCVHPVWEVERRYKLEPGSLKGKATLESSWSQGERHNADETPAKRAAGETSDLIEYWEIWSKLGCGVRLSGMETVYKDHLERTVGDYAYLVVSRSVPYPLNCPTEKLRQGATSEQVKKMFEWPVPFWADDRWPVECLDFYLDPESSWPIPLLGPAMGELKFINTFMGHLCNRIWSSTRDFIAVDQSIMNDVKKYLEEGDDLSIIPVRSSQHSIDQAVKFLQQPQANMDVWRILDAVSELFDKRTGLTEFHYAMNPEGTQNRTAEESRNKKTAAGIRPEFMQKKVVQWQSRRAAAAALCSRWFITGDDVEPLFGKAGRQVWESRVMTSDIEKVVREMSYTVAASSMRRPNKDRDSQNMQSLLQSPFMQVLAEHAQVTGNYEPLNSLMQEYGDSIEMDLSQVRMETPEAKPDPEQQKAEQEMQMEQQRLEGEMQLKQMDLQAKQQGMQLDAAKAEMAMQQKQMEMQFDMQKSSAELEFDERRHAQELTQQSQSHQLNLQQTAMAGQQKMQQSQVEGKTKIEQQKAIGKQKIETTKAMAKAKPKAVAKPKAKVKK